MFSIQIPITPGLTIEEIQRVCDRHKCVVKQSTENSYQISTDDPLNFFWLGMNFNYLINERH